MNGARWAKAGKVAGSGWLCVVCGMLWWVTKEAEPLFSQFSMLLLIIGIVTFVVLARKPADHFVLRDVVLLAMAGRVTLVVIGGSGLALLARVAYSWSGLVLDKIIGLWALAAIGYPALDLMGDYLASRKPHALE